MRSTLHSGKAMNTLHDIWMSVDWRAALGCLSVIAAIAFVRREHGTAILPPPDRSSVRGDQSGDMWVMSGGRS